VDDFNRGSAARMHRALSELADDAELSEVSSRQRHEQGWDDIFETTEMEQVRHQMADHTRRAAADLDMYVALGKQHLRNLTIEMRG
jgi:hypothetical protein